MRPRTLQGRLALTFGAATLVVAALLGVIVFAQFHTALRNALDDDLATRYRSLSAFLVQTDAAAVDPLVAPVLPETESCAQGLGPSGRGRTAAPRGRRAAPVVTRAELRDANVTVDAVSALVARAFAAVFGLEPVQATGRFASSLGTEIVR